MIYGKKVSGYENALCKFFVTEDSIPTASRLRLSIGKKAEIRKHYTESGNFSETARAFKCNESTVRAICKQQHAERNSKGKIIGGAGFKGNKKGRGKPISYPKSIEEELLQWIYTINDQHLPVSVKLLSKKVKTLITPHNPHFKASHGWYEKYLKRSDLSLRKRTSLSQKLPQQLESKIKTFYTQMCESN